MGPARRSNDMKDKKKIIISFVIGLLLGVLLFSLWSHFYSFHSFHGRDWVKRHEHRSKKLLKKFNRNLSLNEEQRNEVENILNAKIEKVKKLRKKIRPQFKKIRQSARAEIRALLTPEQASKFDTMVEEHEKRRKERHGGK